MCFIFSLTQYIQINLFIHNQETGLYWQASGWFLSNTWIKRISLSLVITDIGYFMTGRYMTYKKHVAKTGLLIDLKTREFEFLFFLSF